MSPKHFLDLDAFEPSTLRTVLDMAHDFKKNGHGPLLAGKSLAMVFEKPSTRTRVSFQVGMTQLGGSVLVLSDRDTQLGRGESVADTARVLSRFVDIIMLRTDAPAKLQEMAEFATVPVINGLTDATHPCQIMADILTIEEHRGPIAGKVIAWSGDGNNVATSFIQGAAQFGYEIRLACPTALPPNAAAIAWAQARGAKVIVTTDATLAVRGADAVVTDTWVSMGDKDAAARHALLEPYRVDEALMRHANSNALFLHCLPAHRGEEVTAEVIDGPQSVVWDEAENRMHVQKAIMAWCLA